MRIAAANLVFHFLILILTDQPNSTLIARSILWGLSFRLLVSLPGSSCNWNTLRSNVPPSLEPLDKERPRHPLGRNYVSQYHQIQTKRCCSVTWWWEPYVLFIGNFFFFFFLLPQIDSDSLLFIFPILFSLPVKLIQIWLLIPSSQNQWLNFHFKEMDHIEKIRLHWGNNSHYCYSN